MVRWLLLLEVGAPERKIIEPFTDFDGLDGGVMSDYNKLAQIRRGLSTENDILPGLFSD